MSKLGNISLLLVVLVSCSCASNKASDVNEQQQSSKWVELNKASKAVVIDKTTITKEERPKKVKLPKIALSAHDLYLVQEKYGSFNGKYKETFVDIPQATITEVETKLPELMYQNDKAGHYRMDFNSYGLQHMGRLDRKGVVIITTLGFCSYGDYDIYHVPYWIAGGGGCYFNPEYNTKTKKFTRYSVNGLK